MFADKAYAAGKTWLCFRSGGLVDGIMAKAVHNRDLSTEERIIHRVISRGRAVLERALGTLRRGYGLSRSRYLGWAKVELEFFLNAMAINLKKEVPMVCA